MQTAIRLVREDAEAVLNGRLEPLAPLRGAQVFISGGTGFLGAWLLELAAVLNERHGFGLQLTVHSRHARDFAKKWPHLGQYSWVTFQDGDIRYLAELPRDTTHMVHAAALTDRRLFASEPTAVAEVNASGTLRVIRACSLLENLEKFVFLSSGLVYGGQPWLKERVDEDDAGILRCNDVQSIYAESKRMAELFVHAAESEIKLPAVTLRPFAFVGPYQSLELPWAVTDFIRDSFKGGPIRVMGDGATIRSLMYGSDFAYAVWAALANGKPRSIYNVGSPEAVDLMSLAKLITHFFTPVPEIRTGLGQSGHDRNRLVPATDRISRDLGVTTTVPLQDSVRKAIEWNRYIS